ncbi:MAG TPA: FkbM family methyltransferase [Tepidisphaeraceae bacterium]|jgi:FkbM family methyltransferase
MAVVEFQYTLERDGPALHLQFRLDDDQLSQRMMLEDLREVGRYEPPTTDVLNLLLKPGDRFIDIGAHVGYFSMLAAALVGETGQVYSFEPNPKNYQDLITHGAMNQFANVMPFNWAVGGKTGAVTFFDNADNDGGHALWNVGVHPYNEKSRDQVSRRNVYMTTLDTLFGSATADFAKVMKIDTEGAEVAVLRGAQSFITRSQIPAIIAEVNEFGLAQLGSSEDELRAIMKGHGYTTYLLANSTPFRLGDNMHYKHLNVYNLLFASPRLQAELVNLWPQDPPKEILETRPEKRP